MAKSGKNSAPTTSKKLRPALTPEARESRAISLAFDAAEKQLMEGTASSQVITHFLKLGTSRERLECERLEKENELLRAKTESLQATQQYGDMYAKAIAAFSGYRGSGDVEDEDEYYQDI